MPFDSHSKIRDVRDEVEAGNTVLKRGGLKYLPRYGPSIVKNGPYWNVHFTTKKQQNSSFFSPTRPLYLLSHFFIHIYFTHNNFFFLVKINPSFGSVHDLTVSDIFNRLITNKSLVHMYVVTKPTLADTDSKNINNSNYIILS